jgi:hypothetical protein
MSRTGRANLALISVGLLFAALVLGGLGLLWADRDTVEGDVRGLAEQLAQAQEGSRQRQEVIDKLVEDAEVMRQQLLEEGFEPEVPPPSKTVIEDLPEDLPAVSRLGGDPVPPTDDQVQDAVAVVLAQNPEFITPQVIAEVSRYLVDNPPDQGQPGANATTEMAFAAVVEFCSAPDQPCRGDDGTDGTDGTDGQDGQNVTQEMVEIALADLCSTNPEVCQSTVEGPEGPAGADGRGLVSITCNEDDELVAEYDDQTSQVIEGSVCRFPPGRVEETN